MAANVTSTYDDITAPNKGKGRLAKVADQTGSTAMVYDARGNVITETRIIGAKTHVVSYLYDLADRITQLTYPSGRIVIYTRDTFCLAAPIHAAHGRMCDDRGGEAASRRGDQA